MKRLFSRFAAAALCVAILLSLPACGPRQEQEDDGANGRAVVNLWLRMTESFDIAWWGRQVEQFNAQSGDYFVKVSWVDDSAWDSKILAARENNSAPDVVTYPISGIAQEAQYGTLLPLKDYISGLDALLEDFDPMVRDNITDLNGNVYGIPRLLEPSMLLYYRKDILADAGWTQPPGSMAELEQCCADVTAYLEAHPELKLSKTMQVASANDEYAWVSWAVQAQLTGRLSPLTEDWTAADLTGYERVAEYWADLHDFDGVAPQALTSGKYKDDYAAIFENKVAMQQCGSWIWGTLNSVEDYAPLRDKVGVAPWPTLSGETEGEVLCSLGGWSLAIDRGAACPEGAGAFIEWCLLSEDSAARLLEYFRATSFCKVSPRKSVNDLIMSEADGGTNEMRALLVNVLFPNSMMEPTYPWEISQALGNAYVAFISGGKTAQEAIAAAGAEINGYISQNNVAHNRFN